MMRVLLDFGVAADEVSGTWHSTPLHTALASREWEGARMLLDAGAQLRNASSTIKKVSELPPRIVEMAETFVAARENTRAGCIVILGLRRANAATIGNNGNDVLRMVARCLWSTRGIIVINN